MASSRTNHSFALRAALSAALPIATFATAALVDDSTWSAYLYCATVILLLVMLVDSMVELRRRQESSPPPDSSGGADLSSEQTVEALQFLFRFNDMAGSSEVGTETPAAVLPPESDLNLQRRVDLFTFVGDSIPTLLDLARAKVPVLSGWLGLVSARIARATGTAHAGIMVLRETLAWDVERFTPTYIVEHQGGSPACTLPIGTPIQIRGSLETELAGEVVGASSTYLTTFDLAEKRYWLCIASSSKSQDALLEAFCRTLTAPVCSVLVLRDSSSFEQSHSDPLPPISPHNEPS